MSQPQGGSRDGTTASLVGALVWLLVVGVLVTIVGRCVSAAGVPAVGVVDDWSRVDEATHGVAEWELLVALLAATFLVRWPHVLGAPRSARTALVVALVDGLLIVAGALVGIVGVLQRKIDVPGVSDYYGDTERIGEILVFVAVAAVGVGVVAFVIDTRRRLRASGSDQVEDSGPATVGG